MSPPLITELPACGPSGAGNHPKTLRGPVGKERSAGPRSSHSRAQCAQPRGSAGAACGGAAVKSLMAREYIALDRGIPLREINVEVTSVRIDTAGLPRTPRIRHPNQAHTRTGR